MILYLNECDALGRTFLDTGATLDALLREGNVHTLLTHPVDLRGTDLNTDPTAIASVSLDLWMHPQYSRPSLSYQKLSSLTLIGPAMLS